MEGLQKVLKTMSNEMVEIKKKVAETSTKRPFRNFKINQAKLKPPNAISNAESEDDEEEENPLISDEKDEREEEVELNGMWEFILPNSDSDMEQEAMPVSTRRKSTLEPVQSIPKKKTTTPSTKDKSPAKKASPLPTQN